MIVRRRLPPSGGGARPPPTEHCRYVLPAVVPSLDRPRDVLHRPFHGARAHRGLGAVSILAMVLVTLACSALVFEGPAAPQSSTTSPTVPPLPSVRTAVRPAPTTNGQPPVSGPLRAPGGPYLLDSHGRVVFLHGVNVVYKHPPYVVYPAPGKPWNFGPKDASLMARLGFNVVRLGMTWSGLEPGTAPANDPAICRAGPPGNPGQFNQSVLNAYLARLARTVNLLGRYHIYTILDMHQDVYNEAFDGEGAPNWAVCTNGLKSVDPPGRWSLEYSTAAAGMAFHNFWTNAVVGNLQGEYDRVWGDVARYFRNNPWVAGYDPFNEPFSKSLVALGDERFDSQLECFYTGTAHPGLLRRGAVTQCPSSDPANGVIPSILANDPNGLIFYEPDNYASRGFATFIGPMTFPNLVYNVHVYCGARSPTTGNPTDLTACADQEARSLVRRAGDRPEMASAKQPGGPAWFVSEFGATDSPGLLTALTTYADAEHVGWTYWAWRYYDDPTGSGSEALLRVDGTLRPTARVLSRTYPEAIAGRPVTMTFDPATARFRLTYRPARAHGAPTVIFVPTSIHYPRGYCSRVSGGSVTSARDSELLTVANARRARLVTVTVAPGRCGHG
jgi:endoglycosylceramidase